MRLKDYLKGKDRKEFAEQIGTTKNYVNLLVCNSRRPSPELALKIEQATNGAVNKLELLYPSPINEGEETDEEATG
ncbi:helix-turn-helix domain-containing protein [bacterium]|nr:helix-turn-helix domain-containing protein [bacterium]